MLKLLSQVLRLRGFAAGDEGIRTCDDLSQWFELRRWRRGIRLAPVMMFASIYGRLGGDPREIATKNGKPMTVATIAVT